MNKTVILIPHYNNPKGLLKSISSINEEVGFDILIVDDGSNRKLDIKDLTLQFNNLGKINLIELKQNQGIEFALNTGLKQAEKGGYKYIARLDCGDTVMKNRFVKQQIFLEKHTDIVMLGTNVIFSEPNSEQEIFRLSLPQNDKDIKNRMYYNAMLIHPSIMFRTQVLKKAGYYPTEYSTAEDLAFFFNVSKEGKLANLSEFAVNCELNTTGISISNRKKQIKTRITLIKKHFYFGYYPIMGLIRNYLLLILPFGLTQRLKKLLLNEKD